MSAVSRRARLEVGELFQLKWLLGGVLALVGFCALLLLETSSVALTVVSILLVLGVMARPGMIGRVPAWAWRASTPALIAWVVADFVMSRPDIIAPLLRTVTLLAALRAVSARRRREDLQLVLLALFMVVIAGVLTLSLGFAFLLVVFAPTALLLLFLVTLAEPFEAERAARQDDPWSGFSWPRFLRRLREVLDLRVLLVSAFMFLGVVVASSVIFVAMPRFQLDQALPFLNLQNRSALAGFSENVQLGEVVDIIESDTVALRVDVPGGTTPGFLPYWRMIVLDEYTGEGFRMSASAKVFRRDWTSVFPRSEMGIPPVQDGTAWTFYLEPGVARYLPMPGDARRVRFQNLQEIEFHAHFNLLATTRMGNSVLFYQAEELEPSDSQEGSRFDRTLVGMETQWMDAGNAARRLNERMRYPWTTMAVPEGDQNRAWLAASLAEIGEAPDVHAWSQKAIAWLAARKRYSMQTRIPPGDGDLFLRWLASDAPGHCELFAGSFALLARAAGYPARLVTGFKGGTWNGYENYYMVRNRDAHAWVEVHDRRTNRWHRVDPTPGAAEAERQAAADPLFGGLSLDRTMRAYIDSLRVLWYRRIVNFDQDDQQQITERAREASSAFVREFREEMGRRIAELGSWFSSPWSVGKVAGVLPWVVAFSGVILGAWWLPRWWAERRRLAGMRIPEDRDPVRRRAGRLLERLAVLESAGPLAGEVAAEAARVRRDLEELRFGDARLRHEPAPIWRAERALRKAARRAVARGTQG